MPLDDERLREIEEEERARKAVRVKIAAEEEAAEKAAEAERLAAEQAAEKERFDEDERQRDQNFKGHSATGLARTGPPAAGS